jgi:protein ImuB
MTPPRVSGLSIGLPLANARAICPHARVFDADAAADAKDADDIADWCDRFTPLVALDPRMGCFSTSPAAPICSAARPR